MVIRYKSLKQTYIINLFGYTERIKAINKIIALFKFCLKHPLILFKFGGDAE